MDLLKRDNQFVWHPYTQHKTADAPLAIVRGEGALLFTRSGKPYIDAISSWWVNLHGHGHPYIAEQVYRQFRELEHVIFAGFTHPPAVDLAERLLGLLPGKQAKVFYSDNGSTAVEIGIKMAIQYFHNLGKSRKKLVAFEKAFHGETFGAMSASGDHALNIPFHDHLFEVLRIPAPLPGREKESLDALETILNRESVYAFIFEPLVMGTAGMLMYRPEALDALLRMCREKGVLRIADEVMTGFGRTGSLFASDFLSESPDIICLAKGLTGGTLPLAVTTCTREVYDAFLADEKSKTFFHGHSFTANPLGCAAALASLDILVDEPCREQRKRIEARHDSFQQRVKDHPAITEVRRTGTILALEFRTPEQTSYFNSLRDELYRFFLERQVLLRPLGNVIYILPPYCISMEQLEQVYGAVEAALEQFLLPEEAGT